MLEVICLMPFFYVFTGSSFWLAWWPLGYLCKPMHCFICQKLQDTTERHSPFLSSSCAVFCINHPPPPNQLLWWKFYQVPHPSTNTHTHCCSLLAVWSSLWCIVVFCSGGHRPVTLAKMKGLRCAPSKAHTYGPRPLPAVGIQQTHMQAFWSQTEETKEES